MQLDGAELANAFRPREEGSRCATLGKRFQGLDITLHEGFFLGAGPAFELVFTLLSLLNGFMAFMIHELGGGIKSCRSTTDLPPEKGSNIE